MSLTESFSENNYNCNKKASSFKKQTSETLVHDLAETVPVAIPS